MEAWQWILLFLLVTPVAMTIWMAFGIRRMKKSCAKAIRKRAEAEKTVPYWEEKRQVARKAMDEADDRISEIRSRESEFAR